MATSRGLGKGLSALISENYVQPSNAASKAAPKSEKEPVTEAGINSLAASKLQPGKYQPRVRFDETSLTELADSIRKNGIMQPIIARPLGKAGKYEIIAGERRWRAAQLAGLSEVPVIIREISDEMALEFALVENIQRQDLTPLEEALGYQRLIEEFDYTQEELSNVVGKSRSHIANLLRLQSLPEEVKEMLDKGEITMGHARALLTAENPLELARQIVEKGLNVRQAERYSRGAQLEKKPRVAVPGAQNSRAPVNKDPDIVALEESLSENLGLRVSINDRGQCGEIIVTYDSLMQLDEILQRLGDRI